MKINIIKKLSKTTFLFFAVVFLFCVFSEKVQAATYYVSNSGNDALAGTSEATAWANCPGMTGWTGSATLKYGDTVRFRRGDSWINKQLFTTASGTDETTGAIAYSSYGDENLGKPILNAGTVNTSGLGMTLYIKHDFIVVDGLDIMNVDTRTSSLAREGIAASSGDENTYADHFTIKNCTIRDVSPSSHPYSGSSGYKGGIVIYKPGYVSPQTYVATNPHFHILDNDIYNIDSYPRASAGIIMYGESLTGQYTADGGKTYQNTWLIQGKQYSLGYYAPGDDFSNLGAPVTGWEYGQIFIVNEAGKSPGAHVYPTMWKPGGKSAGGSEVTGYTDVSGSEIVRNKIHDIHGTGIATMYIQGLTISDNAVYNMGIAEETKTSGTLVAGKRYRILSYNGTDNFSTVFDGGGGAGSYRVGDVFYTKGTGCVNGVCTPTVWNGSILLYLNIPYNAFGISTGQSDSITISRNLVYDIAYDTYTGATAAFIQADADGSRPVASCTLSNSTYANNIIYHADGPLHLDCDSINNVVAGNVIYDNWKGELYLEQHHVGTKVYNNTIVNTATGYNAYYGFGMGGWFMLDATGIQFKNNIGYTANLQNFGAMGVLFMPYAGVTLDYNDWYQTGNNYFGATGRDYRGVVNSLAASDAMANRDTLYFKFNGTSAAIQVPVKANDATYTYFYTGNNNSIDTTTIPLQSKYVSMREALQTEMNSHFGSGTNPCTVLFDDATGKFTFDAGSHSLEFVLNGSTLAKYLGLTQSVASTTNPIVSQRLSYFALTRQYPKDGNFATWQTRVEGDTHSVTKDPYFFDFANKKFWLTANSPAECINGGTDIGDNVPLIDPTNSTVAEGTAPRIVTKLISSSFPMGAYAYGTTPTCTPGDANSDSNINISDVQTCINVILGTDTTHQACSDMNGNSTVDITDCQAIINKILNP